MVLRPRRKANAGRVERITGSILEGDGEVRLAAIVPELLFAEGNYGTILLKDDIVKRRARFRYGGKIPIPAGPGLGVRVDPGKLVKYSSSEPIVINV